MKSRSVESVLDALCGPGVRDHLMKEAIELVEELRRSGLRVSTYEVVTLLNIVESYVAATGRCVNSLFTDVGYSIVEAVMAKREPDSHVLRKVYQKFKGGIRSLQHDVHESIRIVGGYGRRLHPSKLRTVEERRAYAILKLLGLVDRRRGAEYVASKSRVEKFLRSSGAHILFKRRLLEDVRRGSRLAAYLDPSDFDLELFSKVPLDAIANLAIRADRASNRALVSWVLSQLSNMSEGGRKVSSTLAIRLYELARRYGVISPSLLATIMMSEPKLVERIAREQSRELVAGAVRLIAKYDRKEATQVLTRLARSSYGARFVRELLSSGIVEPELLAGSSRLADEELTLLSRLAYVEGLIVRALSDGNMAFLEMAMYELDRLSEKLKTRSVAPAVTQVLRRIRSLINFIDTSEGVYELILAYHGNPIRLFALAKAMASSPDPKLRLAARYLARRIVEIYRARLQGTVRSRHMLSTVRMGDRINLRATIRRMLLFSDFPVFRVKRREPFIVLVVDKSGSMQPYSSMAILFSAALSYTVRRLVIFDVHSYIVEPYKMPRDKVLDLILSLEFGGYTNVVSALEEATKGVKPGYLILVSDLRQTVASDKTVVDVLTCLRRRGWKIFVIAPPTISVDPARLQTIVNKVVVVSSPLEVLKVLANLVL